METIGGDVQDGYAGRGGALRGQLSDENQTMAGSSRNTAEGGGATWPWSATRARSVAQVCRTPRKSGMIWDGVGYRGRGRSRHETGATKPKTFIIVCCF